MNLANVKAALALSALGLFQTFSFAMEHETLEIRRPTASINQMRYHDHQNVGLIVDNLVFSDGIVQFNRFEECKLNDCIMQRSEIKYNNFNKGTITNGSFQDAIINNCSMSDITIADSNFDNASIKANLINARIINSSWQNVQIKDSKMNHAIITNVDLLHATIIGTKLKNAVLENVDLSRARIRSSDLKNIKLKNVILRGATFNHVNLKGAQIWDEPSQSYHRLTYWDLRKAGVRSLDLIDYVTMRRNK